MAEERDPLSDPFKQRASAADNPPRAPDFIPAPPPGYYPAGGDASPDPPPAAPLAQRDGPAWEWREQLGFFGALALTTREVLFAPTDTFRQARHAGPLGRPLSYLLIMRLALYLLGSLVNLPFLRMMLERIASARGDIEWALGPEAGPMLDQILQAMENHSPFHFLSILSVIIGAILMLFIGAGVLHVFLKICGGANAPFEATLRVLAYSSGAASVLRIIPIIGEALASLVVAPLIVILGLIQMHETDTWRVMVAVAVLPLLLLLGCCAAGFVAVMMLMGGLGAIGAA